MKTKLLQSTLLACLLGAPGLLAQTNVHQWDFKNGDLTPTIGPDPLTYADATTQTGAQFGLASGFGIPTINGTDAHVMFFPASGASGGIVMPTTELLPNGGGSQVNNYTIVMDVLFPASTAGRVRPLVQTDDGYFTPDADLVVDTTGGIGAPPGPYTGSVVPNAWHRIAFAVGHGQIDEFINGVEVGTRSAGSTDGEFALAPPGAPAPSGYALLFQNSTLSGASPGYVSSIQLWSDTLSAGQIAALGAASAGKIPTNIASIPSFVTAKVPSPNANNAPPLATISGVVNPGGTMIDSNSISVLLDGAVVVANITNTGSNFIFYATPTNALAPYSPHSAAVVYSDSVVGRVTNAWPFTVFGYQNVSLPAPIYFENFDEVAEGHIPAGWVATNWTDSLTAGLDLEDTSSDSYLNWVTISVTNYADVYGDTENNYASPGYPALSGNRRLMHPPVVENGVFLTNLATGNLIVAESDQRGGNQVQVLFTRDYDFTGRSNIYVSFHHLNEQNQDNMCALEYSVDKGTNWLPLLYMFDDGTTDSDGSDAVTNKTTGQLDVFATFNTARNDQAHGQSFGSYIGAPVTADLAPYVRPCRNDDPVQQKRIEVFGLPAAANQPNVRLRFAQAGTGSWFFDIDDLGFYSIPQPIFLAQPSPVVADYNGPASIAAQVGGGNLIYHWTFNGVEIPGANAATYNIPFTASNNIGLYSVSASNTFGAVTSAPIPLTLVFTPIIITTPQDVTITTNDPASFSVVARGGQPLSYQWLFNSNAIVNATNATYAIESAQTNNNGLYQVVVSNAFSAVVSHPAKLNVFAGAITNDLVLHLTFDDTYSDSSPRGNDASPVGSPTFEPGFLGKAVHTTTSGAPPNHPATNNYVTLGYPSDLSFGADFTGDATDFSVAFWVKIFSQNDDQSFIGNKDWNSGSNPGWIIDTEGDGMKWNYHDNAVNAPGFSSPRRDSPHVAPELEDGGWHHILVTFGRHSVGTTYVDGAVVNVQPLAPDSGQAEGSIDTLGLGFSINIGQDGTGKYTDGSSGSAVDMLVDDLAIWRRVLNSHEAVGIFNAGLNSNTVDQAIADNPGAAPFVQVQPKDIDGHPGATAAFYAGVLGSPTLSYQWYFGAAPLLSGTNATYNVTNVQPASAGGYSVIISNNYGAVTSRVATLNYIPAPVIGAPPVGETVDLGATVTFAASATGAQPITYSWLYNGAPVGGHASSNLTLANVKLADAGSYQLVASNIYGGAISAPAALKVWAGPITSNLVAHLTFDGALTDSSGRTNDATYAVNGANPSPSPRFALGLIGQAFEYSTMTNGDIEYATFGYPPDLQFGATNDFTISFWSNFTNQDDDLPFVSNKDWGGSSNPGWIIATQGDGNYRVNVTGVSGADKYNQTDVPKVLKNGNWHNILVSVQHAPAGQQAYVYGYLDGVLRSKHPMTAVGSVDTLALPFSFPDDNQTTWAVNIGQDGTGQYTDGNSAYDIDAKIDDLGIWRRALTANEAAGIYLAGAQGKDLTQAVTAVLFATVEGGNLVLTWRGAPGVELERTPALNPVDWAPVSGTLGASTVSIPLSGGTESYFRLVKIP